MNRDRAAGLNQPVPYGAHGMGLARAGHPERQHVDATVDEVPLTESLDLLSELHRGPVVLEGVPRSCRQAASMPSSDGPPV